MVFIKFRKGKMIYIGTNLLLEPHLGIHNNIWFYSISIIRHYPQKDRLYGQYGHEVDGEALDEFRGH